MKQPLLFLFFLGTLLACWFSTSAQAPLSVSGRVQGYVWNRIGDYDGFQLQTVSGAVAIYFPPHIAASVRRIAGIGKQVEVDVETGHARPGHARPGPPELQQEADPPAMITYHLLRLCSKGAGFAIQVDDFPPPPPQLGKLVQTEGPLLKQILDESGHIVSLLTDKYVIDLKPHQREQISSMLVGVKRLGVVGYERATDGFVNRTGRPLLHPTALTIRGQTFAL